MPKLKRPEDKYRKLKKLLYGSMKTLGLDYTQLAPLIYPNLQKGRIKVSKRFNRPEKLTLDELPRYARALDIPADELRAAIPIR